MKWNGTVSQCEKITIAARLTSEKAAQATSTQANGQCTRGRWTGQRSPGGRCGHRMAGRCNGSRGRPRRQPVPVRHAPGPAGPLPRKRADIPHRAPS